MANAQAPEAEPKEGESPEASQDASAAEKDEKKKTEKPEGSDAYKQQNERTQKELDETRRQLEEATKEEHHAAPEHKSLRKAAFDKIRKLTRFGVEATGALALPGVYIPLRGGHEVLKRTPVLHHLYPQKIIGGVASKTRNAIGDVMALGGTAPLMAVDAPIAVGRGFLKLSPRKYAGPFGKLGGKLGRGFGKLLGLFYQPGKEKRGLIDWAWEKGWEKTKSVAGGIKNITAGTMEVLDKALTTIGLTGWKRTIVMGIATLWGLQYAAPAIGGVGTTMYSILQQALMKVGIVI